MFFVDKHNLYSFLPLVLRKGFLPGLVLLCVVTIRAQQPDTTLLLPADTSLTYADTISLPEFGVAELAAVNSPILAAGSKNSLRLAVLLARVKAYAASLKIFSLSHRLRGQSVDSVLLNGTSQVVPDSTLEKLIPYFTRTVADTVLVQNRTGKRKGLTLRASEITGPFRDGETGIAYGVLLHIKQPRPGIRQRYTLFNNVGHMFITLVKFEADGSHVTRTFGFYPNKENPLSATPLMPFTASIFKDDEDHSWDELVAKFVSRRQFRLVLRKIRQYSRERYHLNKNNCTDFGLSIASIAGIAIKDTRGSWPLGKGNDPGDTGQSILEGKVADMDENGGTGLFVCTNTD